MDRATKKGLLIRKESVEQILTSGSYDIDRASCATSIDGLSCRSSRDHDIDRFEGSPIDLICEQQVPSNNSSSSDDEGGSSLGWPLARQQQHQQRRHLQLSPQPNSCEGLGYFGTDAVVMPSSPRSAHSSNVEWSDRRSTGVAAKSQASEMEMMKERFAKLLLGEDMSGSGKGVCTALAISNALTNLAASVFGELWRLEPLSPERKLMWEREMNWILSVCDHIVEFVPSFQSVTDGTSLEVMVSRPRSDLHINLPALRKLDAMLLEALDNYRETDFWYVDQGVSVDVSSKNHKSVAAKREEDKWWLPVPKIPTGGLSEKPRKALQNQRDCTNQILKAAMAINEQVLSEIQVPDVYWESLPKSARAHLGETIYYGLRQEHFSPDALLSALDLSTEHSALEVANRIQSALHIWRKKESFGSHKEGTTNKSSSNASRYSWLKVRDFVAECGDKRQLLIERADSLILCLRQRYPGLPQTALDVNKIQYNKDVGQAVLESYSRVLESLAYSILSRIDDVLYIDDMTKRNQDSSGSHLGSRTRIALPTAQKLHTFSFQNRISTSTPFATPFASPSSSPSSLSLSASLRKVPVAGSGSPNANDRADSTQHGSCPTLRSICNAQSGSVVEETKKPVIKDRPWFVVESRKSFHSPPGRD